MNRLRKIVRSALSAVLIAGVVLSSSAIAPMTVTPAEAIAPFTILKAGLGGLGSIASSVGPSLVGKILNLTGNSELADFFGLNTNQNLHKIMDDMEDVKTQLGDISEQINDLSDQLGATADHLESWTTLTSFQESYGDLSSTYDSNVQTIKRLMELQDDGDIDSDEFDAQVKQLMEELYNGGSLRSQVYAMGDAIMGGGTSLGGSPTEAYYQNMKQKNGITRDELIDNYVSFSTSVYQDYVMAVMLTNGAMAYLASENGGNINYESQIAQLSQQAQNVLAFLIDERKNLFPSNKIDGYDQALPNTDRTANDYNAVYENGKVQELELKDGKASTSSKTFYEPSEQYLLLNVGEATAVKLYWYEEPSFDLNWSSDNPNVAVVDEFGGVFATGVGTATLTAKYNDETKVEVQVDVVDVTSDGTSISTFTADPVTSTSGDTIGLSQLLGKIEGIEASVDDYTWTTTDSNSVVINGDNVEVVGNSGGYSMVIGTRQVRYDTKYNEFTEIEKVVIPFYVEYGDSGDVYVYDYDDLMYYSAKNQSVALQNDLSTDTQYGKIIAKTKLRPRLNAISINGNHHSIDLTGTTLMSSMAGATVENLGVYSTITAIDGTLSTNTTNMDNAAIVDSLPTNGTIKNCDINVNITGNKPYLGAAANESQGRIAGLNVSGSVTNTYKPEKTQNIKGKAADCDAISDEGRYSIYRDHSTNGDGEAHQYNVGTGGIVGRQDVNASKNNGNWEDTATDTGIYNCYSTSSVAGFTNVGGIVGLAVGDWTNYQDSGYSIWSKPGGNNQPNAAYVKIYAIESRGSVQATDDSGAGIAGGVVGWSVFADIKGAGVAAAVTRVTVNDNDRGRTAGVSGIYMPAFTRGPLPTSNTKYNVDVGFKMKGVIIYTRDVADNNNWGQYAFFYNRDTNVFPDSGTGTGYSYQSKEEYQKRYLFWDDDGSDNTYPTYNKNGANGAPEGQIDEYNQKTFGDMNKWLETELKEDLSEYLEDGTTVRFKPLPAAGSENAKVNYVPHLTTTRNFDNKNLTVDIDIADQFTYGDEITYTATNSRKVEFKPAAAEDRDSNYSTEKPKDVGEYTVRATGINDSVEIQKNFKIVPRTVVFVPPADTDLEYSPNHHRTVKEPYIANLVPGDNVSLVIEEGSDQKTEIGKYELKVTGLDGVDKNNYVIKGGTYTMSWSIVKSEDADSDAIVNEIKPASTELNSAGGNLSLTLTGENLDKGVRVGLFDGNALKSQGEVIQVGDEWTSTLDVPANNTDKDKTYSLMVSCDGGKSWKKIDGTKEITVAGKGSSSGAAIQQIAIDHSNLNHAGGAVIVTVTGQNLASAPYVGLFDGNELLDKSVTKSNGDSYVAVLEVPANTVAETLSYSVRVSENGSTWLSTPVNYLTIAGDPNAEASEGDDHAVFVNTNDYGWLNVEPHRAEKGEKVVITVTPADGCELDEITLMDEQGYIMAAVALGPNQYSFTMPETAVSVAATFVQSSGHPSDSELPFYDVRTTDWFYEAVKFVYDENLMTGTGANAFSPNATTTRGMIVSILARLEGVTSAQSAGFADVNAGDWYATAVNWAASAGVVNGYEDGTFRPNTAITREQLAAILMNYAAYKGEDVSNRADLTSYTDQPSTWAEEAMQWAVAEGLIGGVTADTLQPQGAATRAQVAAILQRFLEA